MKPIYQTGDIIYHTKIEEYYLILDVVINEQRYKLLRLSKDNTDGTKAICSFRYLHSVSYLSS